MTDELLDRLSADLRPVDRVAVLRRLCVGMLVGAVLSTLLILGLAGLRPDLHEAVGARMYWMKFAYTLAYAGLGLWICERLARPAGEAGRRWPWLAVPLLVLAAIAAYQLIRAPEPMRMPMMMGHSSRWCALCILFFALPPFVGLVWAVRGLAPTRLRLTGLVIGLASGGAGAAAYALRCTEMAAPFMAIWYTSGVALVGLVGWLMGPRLLRW